MFETASEWSEALFKLLDWMVDAKAYSNDSVGTLCRWFGQVLNYFENGTTNGIVEGINNRLKFIKRLGFGCSNFDNFELKGAICHIETILY
ncbi:transposase [Halomicronema hongdechloris]|uniref:transposase n=1 Tax=Halomicronema hongdechloris TaxID=1209493 RepID=UPI0009BA46DD